MSGSSARKGGIKMKHTKSVSVDEFLKIVLDYRGRCEELKEENKKLKAEIAKRDNLIEWYRKGGEEK